MGFKSEGTTKGLPGENNDDVLRSLLEELETVGERYEEQDDTEVSQRLRNAIGEGYLRNNPNFVVPSDLGLYSPDANLVTQTALTQFIAEAGRVSNQEGILSFNDRLNALQNPTIKTAAEKNDYEDFFGHSSQ